MDLSFPPPQGTVLPMTHPLSLESRKATTAIFSCSGAAPSHGPRGRRKAQQGVGWSACVFGGAIMTRPGDSCLPKCTHGHISTHQANSRESVAACLAGSQGQDSTQGHGHLKATARRLRPGAHSSCRQRQRAVPPRSPPRAPPTTPTRDCTSSSAARSWGSRVFGPALKKGNCQTAANHRKAVSHQMAVNHQKAVNHRETVNHQKAVSHQKTVNLTYGLKFPRNPSW